MIANVVVLSIRVTYLTRSALLDGLGASQVRVNSAMPCVLTTILRMPALNGIQVRRFDSAANISVLCLQCSLVRYTLHSLSTHDLSDDL